MNDKPTSNDFLLLWKQFNEMAKVYGVADSSFTSTKEHHWSFYYFYGNNFEAHGQNLLEYCISHGLQNVACTMEISRFGMTAYQLEPLRSDHNEEKGMVRQATEIEVLHFSNVEDLDELEEVMSEMVLAEGYLKVIATCRIEENQPLEYKTFFKEFIIKRGVEGPQESEYIIMIPVSDEKFKIRWEYLILNSQGVVIGEGMQ